MTRINRRILLASRPEGAVTPASFKLEQAPLDALAEGQFRVRNLYLSIDPYMRGRMNDAKSYAAPLALGEVMIGETAGDVVESKHRDFAVGDKVTGMFGWQDYGTSDGAGVRKIDDTRVPMTAYLGVAGMPGATAWYGLNKIIAPRPGQTVVVSAASGAVGSVVGQLAKLAGCRAVGIAGGEQKCRYVVDELGFDACVDYKAGNLHQDLKNATPDGVDGCFENVGGEALDATLSRMNPFGRIAVCGMIAGYDGQPVPIKQPSIILTMRLLVQGFIVTEHLDLWPEALGTLAALVLEKKLRYRDSVVDGLEHAPEALIGLLQGKNFGKQLVKIA
ncbi:MAG: NADP-dependent oxidoreductase [Trinickia sp.]|uniref:NADP-dependent oxidoreductase n=1 Tax=Trinickia sp. TaxID=2571163 RepID=UPI003F7E0C89